MTHVEKMRLQAAVQALQAQGDHILHYSHQPTAHSATPTITIVAEALGVPAADDR